MRSRSTLGDGIAICELQPPESSLDASEQQTLLYASDLELGETVKEILEAVQDHRLLQVVRSMPGDSHGLAGALAQLSQGADAHRLDMGDASSSTG